MGNGDTYVDLRGRHLVPKEDLPVQGRNDPDRAIPGVHDRQSAFNQDPAAVGSTVVSRVKEAYCARGQFCTRVAGTIQGVDFPRVVGVIQRNKTIILK